MKSQSHLSLAALLALGAITFSTNAGAEIPPDYEVQEAPTARFNNGPRAGLHLALGFAGNASADLNALEIDYALAPTIGFGLRFEMPIPPIARYFSVGALVEVLSFNPDDPLADGRQQVLDLSILVKGRYPLSVGSHELAPYVVLPFGGTVWFIDEADNYRGVNTGLLAGAEFVPSGAPISIFAELGWRAHRVKDGEIRVSTHQFAMNIGGMFIF